MTIYGVATTENKDNVLTINGKQSICPYVQPLRVQGSVGQVQLIRMPCTDVCPFAVLIEKDNRFDNSPSWGINCSGTPQVFKLEEPIVVETPKEPSKLISL
jgi:hypothetical protein